VLLDRFSSRAGAIEQTVEKLIGRYVEQHGHQPSPRTLIRLRQQATLQSRPDKQLRSLADLTATWHATATATGQPPDGWIDAVLAGRAQQLLTADQLSSATLEGIGRRVVAVVGERRSTWRRWNLHAETSRQLMGVRFATPADRTTTVRRIVNAAEAASVRLTPPELASVPPELQRSDGSSVLRPRHSTVYTSANLLAAEDQLLHLATTASAPQLPAATLAAHADVTELGDDQAAALLAIATSGRTLDLLVGPAGTGKTTTLRALAAAWTSLYGTGSIVGLAPSSAAAEVLGSSLDVPAETLAKWLHDHPTGGLTAGQLVIVDEASLAGTISLDRVAAAAAEAGAKVLLVGDPSQLGAVDAGGALALLARHRPAHPRLEDVRRFTHRWEATATVQLRDGNMSALDLYGAQGRLRDGTTEEMVDAAYTGWRADLADGKRSLLIAPTRDLASALNSRARADRAASGHVDATVAVRLHDDSHAGVGDLVVTRRNHRRLTSSSGRWVRNGDRWTITAIHPDGTVTARATGRSTAVVTLPAGYVAEHLELGYATTAHRAQGATVDTAHLIVTPAMTREVLYVGMTRGRNANTAYTCTDVPVEDAEAHHDQPGAPTGRQVLKRMIARTDADTSAHHTLRTEQDRVGSLAQLTAEYDTIAAVAQRPRWINLVRASGLPDQQAEDVIHSDVFGPLCAALRLADALGIQPDQLLPRLIATAPLGDARYIAAVLHHRLDDVLGRCLNAVQPSPDRFIVGLIPRADGPMKPGMQQALDQRQAMIEQRGLEAARIALANGEAWTRQLGAPPHDSHARRRWMRSIATLAAYRDRHAMTGSASVSRSNDSNPNPDDILAKAALDAARRAGIRPPPLVSVLDAAVRPQRRHGPTLGGPGLN
jgi:hypothetical protein